MENVPVFIDGAYLSKISKHLGGGKYLKFHISRFAKELAKSEKLWCSEIYYYTAPPYQSPKPTENEKELRRNYDRFISKMRKIPNFRIREGRCQKGDGEFHQKGVDALIIRDLVLLRTNKGIKKIIILTCDTDFVSVLNELRDKGIIVILAYFSDFVRGSKFSMSNHILTACDKSILLNRDIFDRCVPKQI